MNLAPYRKTAAAVSIAGLTWATAVVQSPSAPVTASEWIVGAGALLTALGVYTVTNDGTPANVEAATQGVMAQVRADRDGAPVLPGEPGYDDAHDGYTDDLIRAAAFHPDAAANIAAAEGD